MPNECPEWLYEVRQIFPKLDKKVILSEYKDMSGRRLGYVSANISHKLDFNPENLILGKNTEVKKIIEKPHEFSVFINSDLQKIKNIALRKEIVQNIMIHELLHIESEDLITISKDFSRRGKKKIHIHDFKEEIFNRYNKLREIKGIMKIEKREHLEIAISRILESIKWYKK